MVTNTIQYVKDHILELRGKIRLLVLVFYERLEFTPYVLPNLFCLNWSRDDLAFVGEERPPTKENTRMDINGLWKLFCKQVGLWKSNWKTQFVVTCMATRFVEVI